MNLKLITIPEYLLLVDKDDISVNPSSNYWDRAENELKYAHSEFNERKSYRHPVIAHLPLNNSSILEGVPLLPELPKQEENVEVLAEKQFPETNNPQHEEYIYRDIWIEGYKVASKKWSDEDMKKCWVQAMTNLLVNPANNPNHLEVMDFKDFLQSISPTLIPKSFEPEYEYKNAGDNKYIDKQFYLHPPDDKRLKILDGVLQGTYKY